MAEYVPLDRLVLNLLALAEAAPHLSPGVRERLARLADEVEPSVDVLARVGLRIQTELLGQPAFDAAKAAWDALRPERYGLDLGVVKEDLINNPELQQASGIQELDDPLETLAEIVQQAVRDSQGFAQRTGLLQRLAGWVGLHWPRE